MAITFDNILQIIPRYPHIHADELRDALSDLKDLIGLDNIKQAVLGQLAYGLVLLDNPQLSKQRYMLHTLITGPPGVGKSNLAQILGRIWSALGIVGKKPITRKQFTSDQECIYSMARNADFIIEQADQILNVLTKEELNRPTEENNITLQNNSNTKSKTDNLLLTPSKSSGSLKNAIYVDQIPSIPKDQIPSIPLEPINLSSSPKILPTIDSVALTPSNNTENLNTIEKRLNWITSTCEESKERASDIMKMLSGEKTTLKFRKVTRADLVGKWQGHTADQTKKILDESLGGVLFIDEAYQLITSHDQNNDNFGAECLTTLNEFMSEHPQDLIVIFAGYSDTMENTIFRVQPGLKRRFVWRFNIDPYTPSELAKITIKQSLDDGWKLDEDVTESWIQSLIINNSNYFQNYGGDTQRLIFYTAISHAIERVKNVNTKVGTITRKMFEDGLESMKKNESKKPENHSINMYL